MIRSEIAGLPLDQSALIPVKGFLKALEEKNQSAMSQTLFPGAWDAPENSPRGLAKQVMRKGFKVQPLLVGKVVNARASVRALLTHPEQSDWLQAIYFLLAKDDQWLLAGVTKMRPLVGLFLQNEFMPGDALRERPLNRELLHWGEARKADFWRPHFSGLHLATGQLESAHMNIEHATLVASRGVLEGHVIAGEEKRPFSVLLEQSPTDDWKVRSAGRGLAMETIIDGLDIPWTEYKEEVPDVER